MQWLLQQAAIAVHSANLASVFGYRAAIFWPIFSQSGAFSATSRARSCITESGSCRSRLLSCRATRKVAISASRGHTEVDRFQQGAPSPCVTQPPSEKKRVRPKTSRRRLWFSKDYGPGGSYSRRSRYELCMVVKTHAP